MSMRANDLSAFWMPFTNNRAFKRNPRMLARAKDMHYFTPEGRAVLDGTSGLWCTNAGHCREPIVAAIQSEAATLDFAPTFNVGHPRAFELATRLAARFPDGMDKVFFANSGSEAVDTALKIALAYHRARGEGTRTRLIGRQRAYHGVGFGGLSVGGIVSNRSAFLQLPGVDHLSHTLNIAQAAFTRGQPAWGAHLAQELEDLVALHGAENIAAVIVEPMAGSTGVIVPPVGYLSALGAIARKYGILLIFDEVITAFGRLGAATGAERLGVTPDLITVAKGLTNATVPMGAVVCAGWIYEAILDAARNGIEFFHGYTYSAHPLAVAASLATLEVYDEEALFARAADLESYWENAVHGLKGLPAVIDIRNLGLVAGIELEPRAGAPGARAMDVFHKCFDDGLLVRVTGDVIALSPPLIVSTAQIDEIMEKLAAALKSVA
ncbi:MAG TPA: aspartate aminotransferase family protein [Rhizomicrobium sp.]|nr:aspartate aminotransferase family protein [Rhizomicrobium sp.]